MALQQDPPARDPHPHPRLVDERYVGAVIVEGQRQEVWLRSEPDEVGEWHNAVSFRRDGKLSTPDALTTGVDWHMPPEQAEGRASALGEPEWLELYQRALRPRPPIV